MHRPLLLAISFTQGLLLLGLYLSAEHNTWPATDNIWAYPLWTLAITAPLVLLLTLTRENVRRVLTLTPLLVGVLVAAGFYTGWMASPKAHVVDGGIAMLFTVSIGLALFQGLMYLQQQADGEPFKYEVVFKHSWRNFLTTMLAAGVALGVGLVLMLWAALFAAIGVDFFAALFAEPWFFVPVLSLAFGGGVIILRDLTSIIDSVRRLLEGLIRLLLPLLVVVAILFTATLPLVGLQPLWDTGIGTTWLLWLIALLLFFVNAVYQTGREEIQLPRFVQMAVCVGILTLPILCALSFFGLYLRIDEFGWSVGRGWAMLAWFLLSVFSLSYFVGVLRYRLAWSKALARSNIYIGWGVFALMLMVNSPLLDFRNISLNSQLARVERGEIDWCGFDFYDLKYELGRVGWRHGQALIKDFPDDIALHERINQPSQHFGDLPDDGCGVVWEERVHYQPPGFRPPPEVLALLVENRLYGRSDRFFLQVDMDDDAQSEIVVFLSMNKHISQTLLFDTTSTGAWRSYRLAAGPYGSGNDEKLVSGEIKTVTPKYDWLQIDDTTFYISPNSTPGRQEQQLPTRSAPPGQTSAPSIEQAVKK